MLTFFNKCRDPLITMEMGNETKSVLGAQILFLVCSLALSFMLALFFGFLIGVITIMALFMVVAFYNRTSQLRTPERLGYSDKMIGRGQRVHKKDMKLKYLFSMWLRSN
jgi:uncharacterized membrane protein